MLIDLESLRAPVRVRVRPLVVALTVLITHSNHQSKNMSRFNTVVSPRFLSFFLIRLFRHFVCVSALCFVSHLSMPAASSSRPPSCCITPSLPQLFCRASSSHSSSSASSSSNRSTRAEEGTVGDPKEHTATVGSVSLQWSGVARILSLIAGCFVMSICGVFTNDFLSLFFSPFPTKTRRAKKKKRKFLFSFSET